MANVCRRSWKRTIGTPAICTGLEPCGRRLHFGSAASPEDRERVVRGPKFGPKLDPVVAHRQSADLRFAAISLSGRQGTFRSRAGLSTRRVRSRVRSQEVHLDLRRRPVKVRPGTSSRLRRCRHRDSRTGLAAPSSSWAKVLRASTSVDVARPLQIAIRRSLTRRRCRVYDGSARGCISSPDARCSSISAVSAAPRRPTQTPAFAGNRHSASRRREARAHYCSGGTPADPTRSIT